MKKFSIINGQAVQDILQVKKVNQLIYYEFKRKYDIEPDELKTNTFEGKKLRAKLLVNIKDRGGLTYREINELDIFSDVKFNSLGCMYKNAVEKDKKN